MGAVVVILGGSSSFAGVGYNNRRVLRGEAELLTAKNFISSNVLFNSLDDYQYDLKAWSSKNSRIKNPQFHVTISVEGQSMDKHELQKLGEEWLKRMGYADNPYLIYFHNNTENNHIHIITTRVDKNGKKINHNFEKERACRVLNEILNIKQDNFLRQKANEYLHYSFSNTQQFVELCKSAGITCKYDDTCVYLKKDGLFLNLNINLVNFCSQRYFKEISQKDKKRLQAQIFKYASFMSPDEFKSYMRDKFGLDFIYFRRGGGDITGFTVIDFKNKSVYKGSDILAVKSLNNLFAQTDNNINKRLNFILADIMKSSRYPTVVDVNNDLTAFNVAVRDGFFYDLTSHKILFPVSEKLFAKLQYNQRLAECSVKYKPHNSIECTLLSRLFSLKQKDLDSFTCSVQDDARVGYYRDIILQTLSQGYDLVDVLDTYGLDCHRVNGNYVFIDHENGCVFSCESLGISSDVVENNFIRFNDNYAFSQSYQNNQMPENEVIDDVLSPDNLSLEEFLGSPRIVATGMKPKRRKRR